MNYTMLADLCPCFHRSPTKIVPRSCFVRVLITSSRISDFLCHSSLSLSRLQLEVVVVGVCAMSKKSKSRPMLEILDRLSVFQHISVVVFPEPVILGDPVEKWPLCDCLISFHSKGFPLDKAVRYAELRRPMVINDLYMQYKIQDR